MGVRAVDMRKRNRDGYEITVVEEPNFFLKILGFRNKERVFVGDCTVWFDTKTGDRPGTFYESFLNNFRCKNRSFVDAIKKHDDAVRRMELYAESTQGKTT